MDQLTIQQQLHRGIRLTEMLKQDINVPKAVELQVAIIYLGVRGFLDKIKVSEITSFENKWVQFLQSNHSNLLDEIRTTKELSKNLDDQLKQLCEEFTQNLC